ncbi:MAG: hypothetical protein ACT4NL_05030 [Pseudomarimonas sp.]
MAKPLNFTLAENALSFELGSKVDKRALYGYASRIAEKDGKALERGLLLADGALLPRNALASPRVDPEGSPVEPIEVLIDGQPATPLRSSFDETLPLTPASLLDFARFSVRDVYPLTFAEGSSLASGVYRTEFAYRAGPQRNEAMLMVKADGAFLLVGVQKQSTQLGLAATYEFFDADENVEDSDELDFSMV